MKRFHIYKFVGIVVFVLVFGVGFSIGSDVFAAVVDTGGFDDTVALGSEDPRIIVAKIVRIALSFMGVVSTLLILYGGYLWMTSKGDPGKIETAQKVIINSIIGTIIILSSWMITQFVLNALLDATGAGGDGSSNTSNLDDFDPFSTPLGRVLDSHFPPRNAHDIARNVNIAVSFFEAIDPESVFVDYDGDSSHQFFLVDDRVNIYKIEDGVETALAGNAVHGMISADGKQLVFDPVDLLGNSSEDTVYEVELTDGFVLADGDPVFVGRLSSGYKWRFTVSTEIDLTPPEVVRVIPPATASVARNMLVQVYYSEAVNPVYASGFYPGAIPPPNYEVTTVKGADGNVVAGEWKLVNQYRTAEFVSTTACGTNSCGETIYCLPAGQDIDGRVVAADVGTEPPTSVIPPNGIVDMYGNALDGNGDGVAEGVVVDSYDWAFSTTDEIVLAAPVVTGVMPPLASDNSPAANVGFDQTVSMTFDSLMSLSSMNGQNVTLHSPSESAWFAFSSDVSDPDDKVVGDEVSVAEIQHGLFTDEVMYGVEATSRLRSIYQNCFTPSLSDTCEGGFTNCCNNVSSDEKCVYGD